MGFGLLLEGTDQKCHICSLQIQDLMARTAGRSNTIKIVPLITFQDVIELQENRRWKLLPARLHLILFYKQHQVVEQKESIT